MPHVMEIVRMLPTLDRPSELDSMPPGPVYAVYDLCNNGKSGAILLRHVLNVLCIQLRQPPRANSKHPRIPCIQESAPHAPVRDGSSDLIRTKGWTLSLLVPTVIRDVSSSS